MKAHECTAAQYTWVDDMTWTALKGVEAGVKFPGGNKSEFLQQLMDAGEELRLDEEAAAVSRNAATAEVPATSGALMAGAATWAIRNTSRGTGGADAVLDGTTGAGGGPTTAPVEGDSRVFTETLLRAALRAGWVDGARFNLLMSTGDMIETIGN